MTTTKKTSTKKTGKAAGLNGQEHEIPSAKELANDAALAAFGKGKPGGNAKDATRAAHGPTSAATAKPKGKPKEATPAKKGGKMSGLDAAAKILADSGKPMNCADIVEAARTKGLWSTGGKTPAATIYAAIIREIAAKKKEARFIKTERGMFITAKGA